MSSQPLTVAVVTALFATASSAQGLLAQHGEIVHASGMPMPGFPAGAVFSITDAGGIVVQPVIDASGTLVYRARAQTNPGLGIGTTNAYAFFAGRANGDLRALIRQDDPAPGLAPSIRVRGNPLAPQPLRAIRISPFGERFVFGCGLGDPTTPANTPANADSAMYHGTIGALQLLAREGDAVPTVPGAVYGEMDTNSNFNFLLNSSGTVLFRNLMPTGIGGVTNANDAILLRGTPGNLTTFLREGDPWSGVGAAGEVLERATVAIEYPVSVMQMNDAGQILHDVHFAVPSGSATSAANDRALAVWTAGSDVVVAREGDQAPGMPGGAVFADPSVNSLFATLPTNGFTQGGNFVFMTTFPVGPGGVTAADDRAIFRGNAGGSLSLLHREGDPAPASLGAGVTWGSVRTSFQANENGALAFATTLAGAVTAANDTVLAVGTSGAFAAIVREGDAAPGLPGYTFTDIDPLAIALTERSHVLFGNQVTNGTPKVAWFAWTPELGLRLLWDRTDTWTTVRGTSTQPTSFLSAGSAASGDTCAVILNNQGDTACLLQFGTEPVPMGFAVVRGHVGSFVAHPSSVPAAGGVAQDFFVDAGPAQGNRFYFVLASALGTRPGFPSPLGPQQVPLNFDPLWTMLSIEAANSPLWVNTLGLTDATGKGIGPASFVMPPGYPGFAGTTVHHTALLFDGSLTSTFVTEPSALKFY